MPLQANDASDLEHMHDDGASIWEPLMYSLGGNMVSASNIKMDDCGPTSSSTDTSLTRPLESRSRNPTQALVSTIACAIAVPVQ